MSPTATEKLRAGALAVALVLLLSSTSHGQQQSASAADGASSGSSSPADSDSAAASSKATKHATATPIDVKKSKLGEPGWNPKWDKIVEQALPPALLTKKVPRDVRRFCPRFYRMSDVNKRAFWAYFFQALAGAEAGLSPTSHVRHVGALIAQDPVTGRAVHSEGLLQLSYQDSVRYGCDFNWDADRKLKPGDPNRTILRPKNNLECGVKILTQQIISNHKPIFYKLSYWSTLRPGTASYRMFARQMVSPPRACGYPGRKHRVLDRIPFLDHLIARDH